MVASRQTTIGRTVEQIWAQGQGNALIINTDITNALFVSQSNVISASDITIPPLGTMAVDGSSNWFASTLANYGIATQIAPGVTSWNPSPAQVAAQINALGLAKDTTVAGTTSAVTDVNTTLGSPAQNSTVQTVAANTTGVAKDSSVQTVAANTTGAAKDSSLTTINGTLGTPAQDSIRTAIPNNISTTGVPLLNKSTVLASGSAVGISANSSANTTNQSISQPAFELLIAVSYSVAVGTTPFAFVVVQWVDSTSGLVTDKDTFVINVSSNAAVNAFPFNIKGPSKGDTVRVTVYNLDSTQAMQMTYTLLSNSRILPTEQISMGKDWKEDSGNLSLIGSTRVLPDSRVIATFINSSLAANGTDRYTTIPATGTATLNFWETGVAGANIGITVAPTPTDIYGTTPFLVNDVLGGGNPNKLSYPNIVLPNGPLLITVKNGGSVAANYAGILVSNL